MQELKKIHYFNLDEYNGVNKNRKLKFDLANYVKNTLNPRIKEPAF